MPSDRLVVEYDNTPAAIAGNVRSRYTSLHLKTSILLATTLLGLILILYLPLRMFLLSRFDRLQDQAVLDSTEHVARVFADDLVNLERTAANYAAVERPGRWFDANATAELFDDGQINVFLVVDHTGRMLYSRGFDLRTRRHMVPPKALQDMARGRLLQTARKGKDIAGIVLLADDSMLIASRPILTSSGDTPRQGVIVVGRLLNAVEQKRLSDITHLNISFHRLDDGPLNSELALAHQQLLDGNSAAVRSIDDDLIAGYSLLRTIDEQPALMMQVTMPRSIYLQGLNGVFSFSLALIFTAFVFGIAMLILIEQVVLSRLTSLSRQVDAIGTNQHPAGRVELTGNDELNHLADRINGMLDALAETQQRQREEEERVRNQEESLRARRAFISTVSHELRTPLTPIRGFVDLLLLEVAGPLNPDQQNFLHTIKANTTRMASLVDDLLEVGRIEAGKAALNCEPLDLRQAIGEVIEMLHPELARKEMVLALDVASDLPAVYADRKRISQVLVNLLSNAVKYTRSHGNITVSAQQRDSVVEVHITDSGVGMTGEQLGQLFTPFYRADSPLRDEVGGSGLGLSIARSFVELHGGEIWVRSQPGAGSTFGFTLPLDRHAPPHMARTV